MRLNFLAMPAIALSLAATSALTVPVPVNAQELGFETFRPPAHAKRGKRDKTGTGGDTGGSTGDTGGSTGDTGGSTGDTGGSTGDTGGSTGDTGGSTGDTGDSTGGIDPSPDPVRPAVYQDWMSRDVQGAWDAGYRGQGTTITVVDQFNSTTLHSGDMGTGQQQQTHGAWTYLQSSMVAPEARMARQDFGESQAVALTSGRLDVLNLSYGMKGASGYSPSQISWSAREASIIAAAKNGTAVISKAAGNDGVAIGGVTSGGKQDYLAMGLVGGQSAIFVGALSRNGSTAAPASLAGYSNYAGADTTVQDQFLVVGVEGGKTGLHGTSFAAPVVAGYAAVLGSKFTDASATQIADQLLNTARTDTVANYAPSRHGRGEASLSRALAPVSIR